MRSFFVDQVARVFLVLWLALVTLALIYKLFGRENRRAFAGAKLFFLDREFSRLLRHSKIMSLGERRHKYAIHILIRFGEVPRVTL